MQTANNNIGSLVNRGYKTQDFISAVEVLRKYGIDVVVHIMVGLPEEQEKDIAQTINLINSCDIQGVKLHSTYVMKDTKLEEMLNNGDYNVIEQDYYVDVVSKIISNLNDRIIVHRITADPPKEKLIAPLWTTRKKIVMNAINRRLDELDIYQGDNKYPFS